MLEEIERARQNAAQEKEERAFIAQREAERMKLEQQRLMFEQDARDKQQTVTLKLQREAVEEARHAALMKQAKREWELKMLEEREKFCVNAEKLRGDYDNQIVMRKEREVREQGDKGEELREIKRSNKERREMLEALRDEKIRELRANGVDEKYIQSLLAFDIECAMNGQTTAAGKPK